jgi:riboflavin biosynthesis pyrimidine reductase
MTTPRDELRPLERSGGAIVDELIVIIAPVILGAGKRLFDEHLRVRQSRFATFIDYKVKPS